MIYRKASIEDLNRIWDKDIQDNQGDGRYIAWKNDFIKANIENNIATFVAIDKEPVGQISLVFNPNNLKSVNNKLLANKKDIANMATFRIEKSYEGQGHISKLVKLAEDYAKSKGITKLTIGVEAKETRTLGIYLHWGYNKFICSEIIDGELVLFYSKNLI